MKKINSLLKWYFKKKIFRFLFVGGINTIVGYGTFALGIYFNLNYYMAYVLSYIFGVANSYLWNKLFTFKSKEKSIQEFIRFVTIYLISFFIGLIFLNTTIDKLNMNEYIAGLLNLFFTTLISWIGHNKFSFKNKEEIR